MKYLLILIFLSCTHTTKHVQYNGEDDIPFEQVFPPRTIEQQFADCLYDLRYLGKDRVEVCYGFFHYSL